MDQPPQYPEPEPSRRPLGASRWTPALLLAVTFLLGISLGFILLGPIMAGLRGPQPEFGPGGPASPTAGPPLVDRFIDELDLTFEQQEALDRILEENRFKMMGIRRELRLHTRDIADSTRIAIESLLTPEQREKFRELRIRMRRNAPPGRRMPWLE